MLIISQGKDLYVPLENIDYLEVIQRDTETQIWLTLKTGYKSKVYLCYGPSRDSVEKIMLAYVRETTIAVKSSSFQF